MTWSGFWEGFASIFEDVLFIPYNILYNLELDSWFLANIVSWILLLVGAAAFTYWMLQLNKYDEDTRSHYTYNENP